MNGNEVARKRLQEAMGFPDDEDTVILMLNAAVRIKRLTGERNVLQAALEEVSDYFFTTNDQGLYYHPGNVEQNELANKVNKALDKVFEDL